jgi:hypothetical protein
MERFALKSGTEKKVGWKFESQPIEGVVYFE